MKSMQFPVIHMHTIPCMYQHRQSNPYRSRLNGQQKNLFHVGAPFTRSSESFFLYLLYTIWKESAMDFAGL